MRNKHIRDYTLEELENTVCEFCMDSEMTLDEYLCPNCSKDDEAICVECCGCDE